MTSNFRTIVRQVDGSAFRKLVLGSLALAVLAGAPAASAAPQNFAADNGAESISIADFAFLPAELTAPVGTSLTWTNAQPGVTHTATSLDSVWDSGILSSGAAFTFTSDQPGDFAYRCDIHPSMRGLVHIVAPAPVDQPAAEPAAAESVDSAPIAADAAVAADPVTADPSTTPNLPVPTPTAVPTVAPTPRAAPTPAIRTPTPTRYGY